MCYIDTRDQTPDIFTKPFYKALFIFLKKGIWMVKHLLRQEGFLE